MNYEKKYKEALGWMRSVYPTMTGADKEDAEHFFPELKESEESEDERIRKRIIHALHGDVLDMEETTKAIAWLENQGMSYTKKDVDDAYLKGVTDTKDEIEKQYEATYQIRKDIATFIFNYKGDIKDRAKWIDYLGIKVSFVEKQGKKETLFVTNIEKSIRPILVKKTGLGRCVVEHEQKLALNVGPKFKKGEWLVENHPNNYARFIQILEICNFNGKYNYVVSRDLHNDEDVAECEFIETHWHPFNVKDAKDGDVLVCESGWTCIFKSLNDGDTFSSYCFMDKTKWFCETGSECHTLNEEFKKAYNGEIKPATKEQCDILKKAMADAGYTFDFEKKELKKTNQEYIPKHKVGDTIYYNSFGEVKSMIVANVVTDNSDNPMYEDENGSAVFEKDLVEQKPTDVRTTSYWHVEDIEQNHAWSEEDEKMFECALNMIEWYSGVDEDKSRPVSDWLKSLKNRVQAKQNKL